MNSLFKTCLLLALPLGISGLSGCGRSDDDQVYAAVKCARVASELNQDAQGEAAMQKVMPAMERLARIYNMDRHMIEMTDRFHKDVPLHRYDMDGQMQLLGDIYHSSECQDLYQSAPTAKPRVALPFVGKRFFNFFGGSGTGHFITIASDGATEIQGCGDLAAGGSCEVLYSGPYQNPIPGGRGLSWTIQEDKIALRNNGEIENACGMDGEQPCVTELETP